MHMLYCFIFLLANIIDQIQAVTPQDPASPQSSMQCCCDIIAQIVRLLVFNLDASIWLKSVLNHVAQPRHCLRVIHTCLAFRCGSPRRTTQLSRLSSPFSVASHSNIGISGSNPARSLRSSAFQCVLWCYRPLILHSRSSTVCLNKMPLRWRDLPDPSRSLYFTFMIPERNLILTHESMEMDNSF
jgi:hypothetical protein